MAYIKIESVVKGFHATRATLTIGQRYDMSRTVSAFDANAFFLRRGGTVMASMPRNVASLLAPLWDNKTIAKVECLPTGPICLSAKGLFAAGGGYDMPCTFVIHFNDARNAHSLAAKFFPCPIYFKEDTQRPAASETVDADCGEATTTTSLLAFPFTDGIAKARTEENQIGQEEDSPAQATLPNYMDSPAQDPYHPHFCYDEDDDTDDDNEDQDFVKSSCSPLSRSPVEHNWDLDIQKRPVETSGAIATIAKDEQDESDEFDFEEWQKEQFEKLRKIQEKEFVMEKDLALIKEGEINLIRVARPAIELRRPKHRKEMVALCDGTENSYERNAGMQMKWLASPGGQTFSKPIEEMSKQVLNDCLKSFYTSARKQDGSYYKTSSMKSICAAIDRFLHSPPHCKQFSIIGEGEHSV
ncbi:hypothetical protein OS493_000752 [Desmophyllum pertusum]|uniref:Uncharacterized protein n=1 Tax=Desmophyllum pertusum TaxID=174260 RepID=A0A9X0A7T2_9CNID|nr:hypothetical protein OS493_000752 [Desmophyllum pertusum]